VELLLWLLAFVGAEGLRLHVPCLACASTILQRPYTYKKLSVPWDSKVIKNEPLTKEVPASIYYLVHFATRIKVMFQRDGSLGGVDDIYIFLFCSPEKS
jgi:hypothetical protein